MQRQWQRRQFRLELLTTATAWPQSYPIGLPAAGDLTTRPAVIRQHVMQWQKMAVGQVMWREVNFRASAEPIRLPSHWILERPSDWVRAAADRQTADDFGMLEYLIRHADPVLRDALISHLKLLRGRSREELLAAVNLAARLKQGEAQGRPLRLLAGHGVDTKFFERNRQLLIRLLDARFAGIVSEQGLHGFLDASADGDHWLLLVPLQRGLLPFTIQQVRTQELATLAADSIRARRILVIENRQCWHLLPELDDTIAILGSGLDLDWLRAAWLDGKDIVYWGDIDTWGLSMLAQARQHRPLTKAILMDRDTFKRHAAVNAVAEPVAAGEVPPGALTADEQELYCWLMMQEKGRLEQEYLPAERVHEALQDLSSR